MGNKNLVSEGNLNRRNIVKSNFSIEENMNNSQSFVTDNLQSNAQFNNERDGIKSKFPKFTKKLLQKDKELHLYDSSRIQDEIFNCTEFCKILCVSYLNCKVKFE